MANRYWVGDGGNWSDNTNHWSASDGGAPGASKPTNNDKCYFTANSFTTGSQVVQLDEAAFTGGQDWTGVTDTPELDVNGQQMYSYGDITFAGAMVFRDVAGGGYLRPSGGFLRTITSNGLTLGAQILRDAGAGAFTLGDALNIGANQIVVYGSLDTAGFALTCGNIVDYSVGTTKTITFGASTISCANITLGSSSAMTLNLGSATITCSSWNVTASNLTLVVGTSTIKVTETGVFSGQGETFYDVELNGSAHTITGSNTFTTLTLKADTTQTITFTDGTTQTAATFVLTGSPSKVKTLTGSSTAGWTITKTGGGYVDCDYMDLAYSTGSPINTFYAGGNSPISGNNNGWLWSSYANRMRGGGWWLLHR